MVNLGIHGFKTKRGWSRDGRELERQAAQQLRALAGCLLRGPGVWFTSPIPGGSDKPPVTPVPKDPAPSGLHRHLHAHSAQTEKQAHIYTHKIYLLKTTEQGFRHKVVTF